MYGIVVTFIIHMHECASNTFLFLCFKSTPIQNDVQEFWTILNFVDPDSFNDSKDFMERYGDMKSKESVDALHEEIRP